MMMMTMMITVMTNMMMACCTFFKPGIAKGLKTFSLLLSGLQPSKGEVAPHLRV